MHDRVPTDAPEDEIAGAFANATEIAFAAEQAWDFPARSRTEREAGEREDDPLPDDGPLI